MSGKRYVKFVTEVLRDDYLRDPNTTERALQGLWTLALLEGSEGR
jgi:hypothetical protein